MTNAEKIRSICTALGGQRAAARAIGCNERLVRRWCAGDGDPSPAYLVALLAAAAGGGTTPPTQGKLAVWLPPAAAHGDAVRLGLIDSAITRRAYETRCAEAIAAAERLGMAVAVWRGAPAELRAALDAAGAKTPDDRAAVIARLAASAR